VNKKQMTVKQQPQTSSSLNLSDYREKLKLGIVVSEWNPKITQSLLEACIESFKEAGLSDYQIIIRWVPGSYELALGAQYLFEFNNVDGVACLGCIIKGETPHFHYISEATAITIGQLSLKYNRPVSFGVITAETDEHAINRAGGTKGNKGEEAALAVLKMIEMKENLKSENRRSPGFM